MTDFETIRDDLYMQARWMSIEVSQHSHQKTNGYPERWNRLEHPVDDPQSVMMFMSSYWHRFRMAAQNAQADAAFIPKALQQLGKVPNGLTDKVGLILWRVSPNKDEYGAEAVSLTLAKALGTIGVAQNRDYKAELGVPRFSETFMGRGVEQLHGVVVDENPDLEIAVNIALDTAVHGMFTWQAYLAELRSQGREATMPQPGVPSGTLLPWTDS